MRSHAPDAAGPALRADDATFETRPRTREPHPIGSLGARRSGRRARPGGPLSPRNAPARARARRRPPPRRRGRAAPRPARAGR
ncbi:hypothetical protein EOT10_14615 [Streptomyces antnestii]|uniref:Uncharacterized protein n=1 Tax=Streptomyces antnestii TaxID=2494256 RepID=A0A3S2Z071_9ACTN|nr:hypothetical protein EOT10_14615 [Streptomyces sp. San01]